MDMAASFGGLPEELKLAIISFLDVDPKQADKASFLKTSNTTGHAPLKHLSLVSKKWNVLTKSCLLARLVVRISPSKESASDNSSSATRFRTALRNAPVEIETFITQHEVPNRLHSLTICIHESFAEVGVALRNPAQHSIDIISMNRFWRRLFDHLDPTRLSIVAPVSILGWLTTVELHLDDAWVFPAMAVQTLELQQDRSSAQAAQPTSSASTSPRDAAWDTEFLFRVRPWTQLRLREGSMLNAYGGYEYFHKQAPTILRAVATPRSATLTSFSHQVLFPFNTHVGAQHLVSLSYYRHIHFEYAPRPDDNSLSDPNVVGNQIDLGDCWREIEQIYKRAVAVEPLSPLFRQGGCVESFSSGDYGIASIREILDQAFLVHARNGWKGDGQGKWVRRNHEKT